MPKKIHHCVRKELPKLRRVFLIQCGLEDEVFHLVDWKYDVMNDDTKLGYADWVLHNIESHEGD